MGFSIFKHEDKKNKFDVLTAQEDSSKRLLGFDGIPKPTELKPLPRTENKESVETKPSVKEDNNQVQSASEPKEKFIVPKDLIEHINNLIQEGRKLKVLAFDLEDVTSNDDIRNILDAKRKNGLITEGEKKQMLSFLGDSGNLVEKEKIKEDLTPKEEKIEILEKNNEEVVDESDHPTRLRRKKTEKLKSKHGIVVENVGESHTPLEKNIIDKAFKLWKGTDGDLAVSLSVMADGPVQFHKEPETPTRSFDGVLRKPSKSLDFSDPVRSTDKPKNTKRLELLSLEFKGRTIKVIKEADTMMIFYDGKEIARGLVDEKRMDVRLQKEFKAGFLFEKTIEEKAFEEALNSLKTLK